MALNARLAQLLDARTEQRTLNRFGGGTRVMLSGISSLAERSSAIAKTSLEAELKSKTDLYNDGLISNEEMRAFLSKMADSPHLTATEKLNVGDKIRDFDDRIKVSSLEASYKNAPDNSLQKIQAATALANFYNGKAASLSPGTPAQSQALETAGQWGGIVAAEKNQVEKQSRSIKRNQLFQKVYQEAPGSSQEAYEKYLAFTELANQANEDGDTVAATQFAASAQQSYTDYQYTSQREAERGEKETLTANRKQVNDFINTTMNDYKDGRISADQALANLTEADQFAAELGDTGVLTRLNTLASGINRDIDRGITYSPNGAFGDKSGTGAGGGSELMYDPATGSLVYGGGGGGTTTGGKASSTGATGKSGTGVLKGNAKSGAPSPNPKGPVRIDQMDDDYKSQVEQAISWFNQGQKPNGERVDASWLKGVLSVLAISHEQDMKNVITALEGSGLAKVRFNGSNSKISEVIKTLNKSLTESGKDVGYYSNEGIVPVMTLTSEGKRKGTPTFEWKNVKTLKPDEYITDNQGTYYKISKLEKELTEEEFGALSPNRQAAAKPTETGSYKYTSKFVDLFDRAGKKGKSIRYNFDEDLGTYVPEVLGDPKKDNVARSLRAYTDYMNEQAAQASKKGKAFDAKPLTPEQLQTLVESGKLDKYMNVYKPAEPAKKIPVVSVNQPREKLAPDGLLEKGAMGPVSPIAPVPTYKPVDPTSNVIVRGPTGPIATVSPVSAQPQPKAPIPLTPGNNTIVRGATGPIATRAPVPVSQVAPKPKPVPTPAPKPTPQNKPSQPNVIQQVVNKVKSLATKIWPFR